MKLLNTSKLDGRNRITIPSTYLKLIGINSTDFVQITVDAKKQRIIIEKFDDESQQLLSKCIGKN